MFRNNYYNSFYIVSLLALLSLTSSIILANTLPSNRTDIIAKKTNNPLVDLNGLRTGVGGALKYSGAPGISFGLGNAHGVIKAYRNADGSIEELHILVSVEDNGSVDNTDNVVIFFDTFHDHNNADDINRGIQIFRNHAVCGNLTSSNDNPCSDPNLIKIVRGNPSAPVDTSATVADLPSFQVLRQISISTFNADNSFLYAGGWTAEVKISASQLNLNYLPEVMGFFIKVNTGSAVNSPQHPAGGNTADLNTWTNLKTRDPLDLVLLLDQSGSMRSNFDGTNPNSLERWNAAKKSADLMAVSLCPFQEPYFDDRLGLVTYYFNDGNQYEIKPLASLSSLCPFTSSYVNSGSGLTDPAAVNLTPIAAGLEKSFEQFGPLSTAKDRMVVLLSDGFQNRPSTTFDCSANPANPCPELSPDPVGQVQVNTVALGPDTSVGTDLLSDLKQRFNGGFGELYSNTVTPDQLQKAFVENLYAYYYLNEIPLNGSQQFILTHNDRRLFIILFWGSTLATDRGFNIKKPDGTIITTSDPAYHHFKSTGEYELAYYALENISGGTSPIPWQIVKTDNSAFAASEIKNAFVLVDPRLYSIFNVTQQNQNIRLQAVLKEDGNPVSGPDVEVYVDISKPTEGFGTYLSTTNDHCNKVTPVPFDPIFTILNTRNVANLASGKIIYQSKDKLRESILINNALSAAAATPPSTDPLPPAYQLLNTLFQKCHKNTLNRDDENHIKLFDDGSHGDDIAGDGIYHRIFTNIRYEGSYNFTYTAQGKTPTNRRFARTQRLSEYVAIQPAPSASILTTKNVSVDGNMVVEDIRFIPRDKNGEYLGPGKTRLVNFTTTAGKLTSPVRDNLNGIYSQRLVYNNKIDKPVIVAHVRGVKIKSIDVVKKYDITVFTGYFTFDNKLNIDNNFVYGVSFGFRILPTAKAEIEASYTPTKNSTGNSGDIEQFLINLRYDIPSTFPYDMYVIGGFGNTKFKGFGRNASATTLHVGGGFINQINSSLSLRGQARAFRFDSVNNSGSTVNYQATLGLMYAF